jgi:membrane protease YdiL (CAAX protease family)
MNTSTTPPPRSLWAKIFLSPSESRLRAGWRLLIQTLLFFILALCFGFLVLIPYSFLGGRGLSSFPFLLAIEIVEIFAVTLSVFLARRLLDKRSVTSLGLKYEWRAIPDFVAGILITFIIMGLIYLAMWTLGWIHFRAFAWQEENPLMVIANTLLILLTFLLVGWNEELLSRGYHLQTIASGSNTFWGVVLSSAIFGVLHFLNPEASWTSTVGIFFAGLFLAFGFLQTKQLWLPIGLHVGWNFFEGTGFGFPVSGMNFYALTRVTVTGPVLWTGGNFGPEAGLLVLPALAVGALLILLYSKIRRRFAPRT